MPDQQDSPRKLAVLGGGLGSLAAVFELTSDPEWRAAHDVTVYQLGWRLGGKGSSGRDLDMGARNEEHGIHMWMGFYSRAFRMLEACYAQMNPAPNNPLPTVDDAFVGQLQASFSEFDDDPPWDWEIEFPRLPGRPSQGDDEVDLWELILVALAWLLKLTKARSRWYRWLKWLWWFGDAAKYLAHLDVKPLEELLEHLKLFAEQGEGALIEDLQHTLELVDRVANAGSHLADLLHGKSSARARRARQLAYLVDIAAAVVRGVVADEVWKHGYQAIDDEDFVEWLQRHGASAEAAFCAPIRSVYDAMFAYEDGDPARPSAAAGTFLKSGLLTFFGYRGCLYYQMQAGMGDVVFAPIYKVLKDRGVHFEFFTNVQELVLNAQGNLVDGISVGRQVQITAGQDAYEPLVDVKHLPCWPARPQFDKLTNPDTSLDYEMPDVVGQIETLTRGVHFHEVLLGIPVGAHPTVCKQLIDHKPAWQAMVENLGTVATLGVQFWFNRTWDSLGGDTAIVGSALPPQLTIRANSTAVIPHEDWPQNDQPQALSYHCSTFDVPNAIPLPVTDHAAWLDAKAAVKDIATEWLDNHASLVWTEADPSGGNGLDRSYLYGAGPPDQRLDEQFFKPNVTPSELYVQSLPGSAQHRLKAGDSGCDNLVLTGDWIDNEFLNAGFIEGTVTAALSAAAVLKNLP